MVVPAGQQDFAARALAQKRDEFVTACPFYFLVAERAALMGPPRDLEETPSAPVRDFSLATTLGTSPYRPEDPATRLLVLAVRKVQTTFPSMITVGRTGNNDIVLPSTSVSKFHAFFRQTGERLELQDAGSSNGTQVDGRAILKGQPEPLASGASLEFADVRLHLVSAGDCWDWVHAKAAAARG